MTRRRILRWSLLLVIVAAFAVWLEPTRVVWGWLRGEAFYQGRPTSYWSRELAMWRFYPQYGWVRQSIDVEVYLRVHDKLPLSAISEAPPLLRDKKATPCASRASLGFLRLHTA
jgi:hypothetical protein